MNTKSLTYLISGAGLLLAASPLMAATVDNINVPTTPGDHAYFGSIMGNRALSIGDTISGHGNLTGIVGGPSLCASGSTCSLTYSFSDYTLDNVTNGGTRGFFTGGEVTFTANGSQTFLTTEADPLPVDPSTNVDDTQYTLIATKTTGADQNGAFGLLSATGGDAFSVLNRNNYANGGGGFSDLLFNTSWTPTQTGGDFQGSADVHFQVSPSPVPEPSELGLLALGLALIGGGVAVRRRKNA